MGVDRHLSLLGVLQQGSNEDVGFVVQNFSVPAEGLRGEQLHGNLAVLPPATARSEHTADVQKRGARTRCHRTVRR